MNILQFKKKEITEEIDESYLMTFDDIPKKRVPNKYIVVEHRKNGDNHVMGYFDTEIQALKVFRKLSSNSRSLFFGTAVYLDGGGLDIMYSYEDVEIIL